MRRSFFAKYYKNFIVFIVSGLMVLLFAGTCVYLTIFTKNHTYITNDYKSANNYYENYIKIITSNDEKYVYLIGSVFSFDEINKTSNSYSFVKKIDRLENTVAVYRYERNVFKSANIDNSNNLHINYSTFDKDISKISFNKKTILSPSLELISTTQEEVIPEPQKPEWANTTKFCNYEMIKYDEYGEVEKKTNIFDRIKLNVKSYCGDTNEVSPDNYILMKTLTYGDKTVIFMNLFYYGRSTGYIICFDKNFDVMWDIYITQNISTNHSEINNAYINNNLFYIDYTYFYSSDAPKGTPGYNKLLSKNEVVAYDQNGLQVNPNEQMINSSNNQQQNTSVQTSSEIKENSKEEIKYPMKNLKDLYKDYYTVSTTDGIWGAINFDLFNSHENKIIVKFYKNMDSYSFHYNLCYFLNRHKNYFYFFAFIVIATFIGNLIYFIIEIVRKEKIL